MGASAALRVTLRAPASACRAPPSVPHGSSRGAQAAGPLPRSAPPTPTPHPGPIPNPGPSPNPTRTPTPTPNPTQERPSSRSAAERLHASTAEHFPNPAVLTPLLPSPGHTSEGPRGGKSRRQTPSRSPARSPPLRSPVRSPGARGQLGQRNSPSTTLGADLPDLVAVSAATPSVPAEAGITGWG